LAAKERTAAPLTSSSQSKLPPIEPPQPQLQTKKKAKGKGVPITTPLSMHRTTRSTTAAMATQHETCAIEIVGYHSTQ
jgi:hypothetical protein